MTTNPVRVKGKGPSPCDYMIVGEAPGRDEIKKREPFVGYAGTRLDEALERVQKGKRNKKTRASIYTTNAYKGDVGAGNRNPTAAELDDHHSLLLDEIRALRPSIILALGRVPTRRLAPDAFRESKYLLGPLVGEVCKSPFGVDVIPCYHPAARIGKEKRAAADDALRRFLDYPC